jgi:hypothetical protein
MIHDRDHVCERLLFLAVERAVLKGAILRRGALRILPLEIVKRLAEKLPASTIFTK